MCCNVSSRTRYKMHSNLVCYVYLRTWYKTMVSTGNAFDFMRNASHSHGSKPGVALFKTCQVTWFQSKLAHHLMTNSQNRTAKHLSRKKKKIKCLKKLASSWRFNLFILSGILCCSLIHVPLISLYGTTFLLAKQQGSCDANMPEACLRHISASLKPLPTSWVRLAQQRSSDPKITT